VIRQIDGDQQNLVRALSLFADLLLHELDAETLVRLQQPELRAALGDLGIEVPEESELESLASQYFECFLHPERGAPPIASLWIHGQYEGEVTAQIRKIAEAEGCTLDSAASAGAPIDHLGCLLLLWVHCMQHDETLADLIAEEYLTWVPRALRQVATQAGFYGQLASALLELVSLVQRTPDCERS